MTHKYTITGMTCTGCQAKVQKLLVAVPGVRHIDIDLPKGEAAIEMDKHIPTKDLQAALKDYPKYQLAEARQFKKASHLSKTTPPPGKDDDLPNDDVRNNDETRSWLATYKPILLIFGYITVISLIAATSANAFNGMMAMRIFMSGFFLTFSFFKMLDLEGFANSYAMYDILAKRSRYWGHLYPFVEAALGIAFALNFQPLLTNLVTLVVMGISIIGVLQSVLNKRKIQCACLGAVFNLPMSTVTIIEDGLMIAMSGFAIAQMAASHQI